jgi:hypothetical protein
MATDVELRRRTCSGPNQVNVQVMRDDHETSWRWGGGRGVEVSGGPKRTRVWAMSSLQGNITSELSTMKLATLSTPAFFNSCRLPSTRIDLTLIPRGCLP